MVQNVTNFDTKTRTFFDVSEFVTFSFMFSESNVGKNPEMRETANVFHAHYNEATMIELEEKCCTKAAFFIKCVACAQHFLMSYLLRPGGGEGAGLRAS